MLIEEVGKQWQALQKVKDAREKSCIQNRIIVNIQTSDFSFKGTYKGINSAKVECTSSNFHLNINQFYQLWKL